MNAVKIFNEKKADELIFLDITATKEGRTIDVNLVREIGEECLMPFGVGGGINDANTARDILSAGAEKISINTAAYTNPDLIKECVDRFGAQSVVVSMDVKPNLFGKMKVYVRSGSKSTGMDPVEYAQRAEHLGAGEIVLNSIHLDGTRKGFDTELVAKISKAVRIPVIALGGAGDHQDLRKAIVDGQASAVSAGSLFVYQGRRNGVLINFPSQQELIELFN